MVASIIVIIQLVRRNDGTIDLQDLLDCIGGVKESLSLDMSSAGKCLSMACEAKKAS